MIEYQRIHEKRGGICGWLLHQVSLYIDLYRQASLFKQWKRGCCIRTEVLQQDLADLDTLGDDLVSNISPMEGLQTQHQATTSKRVDRPPSSLSSSSAASSRSSSSDTPVGFYEGSCPTLQPGTRRGEWVRVGPGRGYLAHNGRLANKDRM